MAENKDNFDQWQKEQLEMRKDLTGDIVALIIDREVSYEIACQALKRAEVYIKYFTKVSNYTAKAIVRMLEEHNKNGNVF